MKTVYQTNFNEDSAHKDTETQRISYLNVRKNTESKTEDESLRGKAGVFKTQKSYKSTEYIYSVHLTDSN